MTARIAAYVFLAAVAIRLLAWVEYRNAPSYGQPIVDAEEYENAAAALQRGDSIGPPYFRPPLYPWLVSRIYQVTGGDYSAVVMFQIFLSSLAAMAICAAGFEVGMGISGAALAGLFFAFYGPAVFYDLQMVPVSAGNLLMVLGLLGLIKGNEGLRLPFLFAGASFAAASLCVPLCVLVLPVAVCTALFGSSRGWKFRSQAAGMALAGALLVLGPAMVRNHRVTGRWLPLTVNGGVNLFLANNPEADRTMAIRPGPDWDYLYSLPRSYGICDQVAADNWFYAEALSWMLDHPRDFLAGYISRLSQLVAARELPRTWDIATESRSSRVLGVLNWHTSLGFWYPFGVVYPLAVVGVVSALCRGRRWLAVLLLAASYMVFLPCWVVCSRYRLLLVPAFCLLAGEGIRFLVVSRGKTRGVAVFLVVVAALLSNRVVRVATDTVDFGAEQQVLLGLKLARIGDDDGAAEHYRNALSMNPVGARAPFALGLQRMTQGDFSAAARYFETAVARYPGFAEAYLNLAVCRTLTGDHESAFEVARAAAHLRPRLWKAHDMLGTLALRRQDLHTAFAHFYRAWEADRCVTAPRAHILYILAAHPDIQVHNRAVGHKLARSLRQSADNPVLAMDVLAMWLADCGEFNAASRLAAAAADLAKGDYREEILHRKCLYDRDGPFRDGQLPPMTAGKEEGR